MGNDLKEARNVTWPKISLLGPTADCYRAGDRGGSQFSTGKWEKSKHFLPPLKSHHVDGAYSVPGGDCVTLGKSQALSEHSLSALTPKMKR